MSMDSEQKQLFEELMLVGTFFVHVLQFKGLFQFQCNLFPSVPLSSTIVQLFLKIEYCQAGQFCYYKSYIQASVFY